MMGCLRKRRIGISTGGLLLVSIVVLLTGSCRHERQTSFDHHDPPKEETVTTEQLQGWVLGCSGVLWERNRDGFTSTGTWKDARLSAIQRRKMLGDGWDIHSRDDFFRDLAWLSEGGGHRDAFARDGRWASMMTAEQLEAFLAPYEEKFPERCNKLRVAHRYYESLGDKGILGWDMSRYICLCRWGYICGWINEQTAWQLMIPAAELIQERFDSWEELGRNYLIGRHYWSLRHVQEDKAFYDEAYDRLIEMPSSPWNRYPWDLDLRAAYERIVVPLAAAPPEAASLDSEPNSIAAASVPAVAVPQVTVPECSEPNLAPVMTLDQLRQNGTVRVVPEQYPTIQSAILSAETGDTVFVQDGVYTEEIQIEHKDDIRLIGQSAVGVILSPGVPDQDEVVLVRHCGRVLLSDMTIEDRRTAGDAKKNGICASDTDLEVVRCRISNQYGNGFSFYDAGKYTVYQTRVESCAFYGALLADQTAVTISKCSFRDNRAQGICGYRGVSLDISQTLIEGNDTGLFIAQPSSRVALSDCIVRENADRGVIISEGGRAIVKHNIIIGNGRSGIHAADPESQLQVFGSTMCANGETGIFVQNGASAAIEDNDLFDNAFSGIEISQAGAAAEIGRNRIYRNGGSGILLSASSSGILRNNQCRNNLKNGIDVYGENTHASISDTQCFGNGHHGISIWDGARASVENSRCENNIRSGISVFQRHTRAKLVANDCGGNFYNGIVVGGGAGPVEVRENRCAANYPSGIFWDAGAHGQVTGNRCRANPWAGLAVKGPGAAPAVTANDLRGNGTWGIRIWDGAAPVLADNRLEQNGKAAVYRVPQPAAAFKPTE